MLEVSNIFKTFHAGTPNEVRSLRGVSLSIAPGETLGLVGESGCGKSTTSMMVMRLLDQSSGRISFDGEEIGAILPHAFARLPQRVSGYCSPSLACATAGLWWGIRPHWCAWARSIIELRSC